MAVAADLCSAFHCLGALWAGFYRRNRRLGSCQCGANFAQVKAPVRTRRRYSPGFDKLFHLTIGPPEYFYEPINPAGTQLTRRSFAPFVGAVIVTYMLVKPRQCLLQTHLQPRDFRDEQVPCSARRSQIVGGSIVHGPSLRLPFQAGLRVTIMGSHDFLAGVAWNSKDFNVVTSSEVAKVYAADWRAVEAGRQQLTSRPSRVARGEVPERSNGAVSKCERPFAERWQVDLFRSARL
jgi:hypothetical protein